MRPGGHGWLCNHSPRVSNNNIKNVSSKIGTFYLTVFTLLIDFIWALYWGEKWENVPTLFHEMTLFLSWCGIILKIFVILITLLT